jgi:PAS domain S-box-containing protein
MVVSKLLLDLIPIMNSAVSEDEVTKHFTRVVSEYFGIDRISMNNIYEGDYKSGALLDYVLNTKKTYVDNQLSEFSSFSELIGYKNSGFRSCAVMPILAAGKVVSVMEMLSSNENKFSDELVNNVAFGASFIGFALMYRYESGRSTRLASYFDGAFNGSVPQFLVSSGNVIVKANKSALNEFGYSIPGSDVKKLLNLDFKQLSLGAVRVAVDSKKDVRMYQITSNSINEKLAHVSVQDVTELTKFRAALSLMDESSYSGIMYLDVGMAVTSVTESIKTIMGYESTLIVGKVITDLVLDNERAELKERLSMKTASNVSGFFNLVGADSSPVRVRYVASKFANGYVLLFTNAKAEQNVDDIRSTLADFMDNTSDMVMTVDTIGLIKSANLSAESVLGYTKEQLIGKDIRTLYVDSSVLDRDMVHARKGTKVDNSYADLLSKSGSQVPATHSMRSLKDPDGNPIYLIVTKELATRRMMRDQEAKINKLTTEASRLKSTSDLKSQFIYNITHELKTPLTNINGYSKLLYEGGPGVLNAEQKDYVSTIIDEVERLTLIIKQVLEAAKLDSNKVTLELKSDVDLKELENNPSIKALRESAENKKLTFTWNTHYDVPKITADPNRLIQVFVNLIGNAVKFTEKGGITVEIKKKSKMFVECSVTDTGIGMSAEDKRPLFKKFYQAPKKELVKQEQSGTGLGLSITKDIITLHNGKIGIDPQPGLGEGSRFWFILPIKPRAKKKQQPQA